MPRQVPPVIPTIEPREPYIIQPIRPLPGPLDLPPPVTNGFAPVPGLTPPDPNVPTFMEPRIDLPPVIPHDIGEEEAANQTQADENEEAEQPPEDIRDLPIDERQFPTFNDPAYDVPIPEPTVTVPLIEAEVPIPDTGMLVTTATTAAVAAAGAVAATQAIKPLADFLIKQFKTGFKILFNKLLKKKQINYLDEKKFRRVQIELPARLRFERGRPPLGQLRLGTDLRKEKKDAEKRQKK